MGSWTTDATLVDFMRGFVVATNRLRYAEERNEVDASTMVALQRSQRAAAVAFEAAVLERGWQLPRQYTQLTHARAEAVSL
ncbi:MAG: hypothetical protein ACJ735_13480 [Actinomycetes bacterium]